MKLLAQPKGDFQTFIVCTCFCKTVDCIFYLFQMVLNVDKVSLHVIFADHTEPNQSKKLSTSKDIGAKQNSEILVC
jgi:hypothetical protein